MAGLVTLRDQLAQEFGDLAVGLENLDQSFNAPGYGSFDDPGPSSPGADVDQPNQEPGCMQIAP